MITTRNLLAGVATAALIAGAAGAANAAATINNGVIQIDNDNFVTPGINNFWGAGAVSVQNTSTTPATVSLIAPGAGTFDVTFTLVFREAGWNNKFVYNPTGDTLTNDQIVNDTFPTDVTTPPNFFTVTGVSAGVLDFSFFLGGPAPNNGLEITNDAEAETLADNVSVASFLGTITTPAGGTLPTGQMYLALDDGGGVKADGEVDDDNHDDMIILVSATFVPQDVAEPVTLGILGLGLAGIGLMARRRRLV